MEAWRPVVGYEGLYEVSNLGRVRSLTRETAASKDGRSPYVRTHPGMPIQEHRSNRGYAQVGLSNQGKRRLLYVHRLVALAFLGAPTPESLTVNHKSGDKRDNRVENLEYLTPLQQMAHARNTLHLRLGRKLTAEQVAEIRTAYAGSRPRQVDLAKKYGVTQVTISHVVRGMYYLAD